MTENQPTLGSRKIAAVVGFGFVALASLAVRWLEENHVHHRWHQETSWVAVAAGCLLAMVVAVLFATIGMRLLNRPIGVLMAAASGGLAMAASGPVPGILVGAVTGGVVTLGYGRMAFWWVCRITGMVMAGVLAAVLLHRFGVASGVLSEFAVCCGLALLGVAQLSVVMYRFRGTDDSDQHARTRAAETVLCLLLTLPFLPLSWLVGWHVDRNWHLQELVSQRSGEIRFIVPYRWQWAHAWEGRPVRHADLQQATVRDLRMMSELSVLRELRVTGYRGTDSQLLGALREAAGLRRLRLTGVPRRRESLVPVLTLPGLQRCQVDDLKGRRVTAIANATKVHFTGASISDEDLYWLRAVPGIETLTITDCPRVSEAGLAAIGELGLQRLELTGDSLTDQDLRPLATMPLKSLKLNCPGVTALGLRQFAQLPDLQVLQIEDLKIDAAKLRAVSIIPMKRLVLGGKIVEPEALELLCTMNLETCHLYPPLRLPEVAPLCRIKGLRGLSFVSSQFDLRLISGLRTLGRQYPIHLEVGVAEADWLTLATASALCGASFSADNRLSYDGSAVEGNSQICLYQPANRWKTPGIRKQPGNVVEDNTLVLEKGAEQRTEVAWTERDMARWREQLQPEQLAVGMPFVNEVGMRLVPVPAGHFFMGFGDGQVTVAEQVASQRHPVRLTRSFFMGAMEVTQEQFQQVTGRQRGTFQGSELPVETVTWQEANTFCQQLSQLAGERAAGRRYRLPTEAEWEYACRAGSDTEYTFGNRLQDLDHYAWHVLNAQGRTHQVGGKRPNAWGLFDMHGNVYEWVQDWHSDDYYSQSPITDPTGPNDGVVRVARGGGWAFGGYRCAFRAFGGSGHSSKFLGFRVVCETTIAP
ncbi:MAG: hypothetical protein CMJ75_13775 [Planctomycetaceae bacterium]|nr:hypothetical protein [Planctomycetaceae bacterium]